MYTLIYISIHKKPKTQKILKQNMTINYYLNNGTYSKILTSANGWVEVARSDRLSFSFVKHLMSHLVFLSTQIRNWILLLTILLNKRDNSSTILLLFRKPKRYFIRKVMTNCSALSLICITLKTTYYRLSYE